MTGLTEGAGGGTACGGVTARGIPGAKDLASSFSYAAARIHMADDTECAACSAAAPKKGYEN